MKDDPEKIATLLDSLDHPDKSAIRAAVDSLIPIALHNPDVCDSLSQRLMDPSRKNRWAMAYILAHVPNPPEDCHTVLVETLDSRDPDIRWAVGLLLVRLAKNDRVITSRLFDLLKRGTSNQRRMAVYCIRDMNLKDDTSLQALLKTLQDPEPLVRVAATTSLKMRSDVGKEGLDSILHLFLEDPDSRVRYSASLTLAALGAPTEQIRTALEEASRSDDPHLKKAAAAALVLLKKRGPVLPTK
jgi:HEAT repeat protein